MTSTITITEATVLIATAIAIACWGIREERRNAKRRREAEEMKRHLQKEQRRDGGC